MWNLVFFDLPVTAPSDQKASTKFRDNLLKDGFQMFQFSIYVRHSISRDGADLHKRRVKGFLPKKGKVGILQITDKQFGMIELFEGGAQEEVKPPPQQLEFF
jgi:CRISPR-associated protein Cas2